MVMVVVWGYFGILYLKCPLFNSSGHLLGPVDGAHGYHHLPRPLQDPLRARHLCICCIRLLCNVLKTLDHNVLDLKEPFLHHSLCVVVVVVVVVVDKTHVMQNTTSVCGLPLPQQEQ